MSGMVGTVIGHFLIEAEIGRGGMGVVYRARDTTLGRVVALKVLLPELVRDPGRRARFLREARTAAAVNHPNVATVYEVGESGETVFLAMEHVDGESLRALLTRERPPAARVAELATAIATALAAAHDAKVIHRDLKPANVLVGRRGEIKLCDFGLAKSVDPGLEVTAEAGEPLTRDSAILGTPAYMSPEQCRGRPLDPRSDLFSFGTMLYELLAGRRPFAGDSYPELGIAIMNDPPPPLPADAPAALARVVARCLEKRAEDRYPDAHALLAELTGAAAVTSGRPRPAARRRAPLLAGIAAAAVGAGGWLAIDRLRGTGAAPPDAAPAAPPPGEAREAQLTTFPPETRVDTVALAPDGRWYAYANSDGAWIAELDRRGPPRELVPPDGFDRLFPLDVFPDGRLLVGFFRPAGDGLGIFDPRDGDVEVLASPRWAGARVSSDGTRVAFFGERGLRVMGSDGSDSRLIAPFAEGDNTYAIDWSPDGRHVAFIRDRWTRDGWQTVLEVAAADGTRLEAIPTRGHLNQLGGVHGMAWMRPDRIVYAAKDDAHQVTLWAVGVADGRWDRREPERLHGWQDAGVDWLHAAGDRLVFVKNDSLQTDVWVAELDAGGGLAVPPARLTLDDRYDFLDGWTPDGAALFHSDRHGTWDVFFQAPGDARPTLIAGTSKAERAAEATGDAILYFEIEGTWTDDDPRCTLVRLRAGATDPEPLLALDHVAFGELGEPFCARLSCAARDPGRCILVESVGAEEVVSLFDPRADVLVRQPTKSRRGGALSPDGRTLARFRDHTGTALLLVDLATGAETELALDRPLPGGSVAWRPDRDGWIAVANHLLNGGIATIDARGAVRVLWWQESTYATGIEIAPDGRHVAFVVRRGRNNIFRLDGLEP